VARSIPSVEPRRPGKCFPPADDDADLDAQLDDVANSSATCSTLGEMPYLLSPISASPESFSRMRLNRVGVGFSGKVDLGALIEPRES